MALDFKDCFELMAKHQVSDLHLKVGAAPVVRKNGQLMLLYKKQFYLTNEDISQAIDPFLKPHHRQSLMEDKQVDFSYGIKGIGRFRFNIFYQRGTLRVVARNISFKLPNFDSLSLPPAVRNILNVDQQGLILVTGATGNGKSSTIVAMLNDINEKWSRHIITIEDPIEFLIEDKKSLITQRELGVDYISYNMALKSTLRQDPDIIFFGELRDFSSMETALTAANTGHLVFSTLHTNNVPDTIHRVLSMVGPEKKKLFRMEFASSLKAIICQKLVVKKDKSGMVPVVEILINNPRVRAFLEDENKSTSALDEVIEGGREVWGMQSFNQHLIELAEKGLISKEIAMRNSPSPEKLKLHFSGLSHMDEARTNTVTQIRVSQSSPFQQSNGKNLQVDKNKKISLKLK